MTHLECVMIPGTFTGGAGVRRTSPSPMDRTCGRKGKWKASVIAPNGDSLGSPGN